MTEPSAAVDGRDGEVTPAVEPVPVEPVPVEPVPVEPVPVEPVLVEPVLSPLDAVMAQVRAGTGDPLSISLLTGMEISVVRACLDHLVRTGRLRAEVLASACSGVCGGCPATQLGCGSASADARAVGGNASPARARGLRVISVRH